MLVATRDPMHHSGAPDPSSYRHERTPFPDTRPQTTRVVGLLQLAGSFLAIPVALGSAYSVYQANFSPDTQCQQLRASIIAMIDKKIDAATRRMLVRRDVETFEKSCGAFDPDARTAFLTLLATEPHTVPARSVAMPKSVPPKAETAKTEASKVEASKMEAAKAETRKTEAKVKAEPSKAEAPRTPKAEAVAKETVRKIEPRAPAIAKSSTAEADVAAHEDVNPDARWLDAVRSALLSHDSARATAAAAAPVRAPAETPALKTTLAPSAPEPVVPATASLAPALPPATDVAAPAEPPPARSANADDHPVPPAAIPDGSPLDIAKAATDRNRSSWISSIPLVGPMLDQ